MHLGEMPQAILILTEEVVIIGKEGQVLLADRHLEVVEEVVVEEQAGEPTALVLELVVVEVFLPVVALGSLRWISPQSFVLKRQ